MKSNLTYLKKPDLFNELNQNQSTFLAVIDEEVKCHLPDWVKSSDKVFWIKNPEANKNLKTFEQAVEFFLNLGISREAKIYAIGGGATTDLGGFVASALLRGIPWISIPTTLLGIVDGSIGGKVAVNMPQGKNLVGAFHAPDTVYICLDFLSTLPEVEWASGKGEVLKYGFLSKKIFERIIKKDSMDYIAQDCAEFKKQVVDQDFKEKGNRIYLNLGHTLGHAFESTLKIPHGLAVAMGIKYLLKVLSLNERSVEWEKLAQALELPLEKTELSHYPDFSVDKFKNYLLQDKKKVQDVIRLVLIKEAGSCFVKEMNMQDFINHIEAHEDFKR
ncbi:MAG: 3-dehydroquinate synthase [Bdellovibrionales bacterium]|nr:3-dehydroquinate synthase [Bdellovibrionales bacterium]